MSTIVNGTQPREPHVLKPEGCHDLVVTARLLIVALLIGALHIRPTGLAAQQGEYRVLLLNSDHHGLGWTDGMVEAIRSRLLDPAFNPVAGSTELYIEYMDAQRVTMDEALEAQWYEYLDAKYERIPPDLIMVTDNDAYDFLRRYYQRLFPSVPVVFGGIDLFQSEDLADLEQFTGVVERVDIRATIDVALDLHPETREIYVVNDGTATGRAVQQQLNAVVSDFEDRVDVVMLTDPSRADLEQLKDMPADSLVLLIVLNRDRDGNFYTYEEGIALLSELTDRPIYGVWDFYMGWGHYIGGMLTNAGLQGRAVAELAIQVLNGADVRNLPIVQESPNRYMFDYAELRRFSIPVRDLPGRTFAMGGHPTVIVNQPPSFLEEYGPALGGLFGVVVIAMGVVLMQRRSLHQQRRIEAELREANAALEETHASMEAQVRDRTRDLEDRSNQVQLAFAVAQEIAGIGDVDALMSRVTTLISESFGYYHTGIFLIDASEAHAVLRAASSSGGQQLMARGHRLKVGEEGIVGYVSEAGDARIALDVTADVVWRNTDELARTRSEMALPLKVQDRVIGVLDIQSEAPGAFRQDDVEILGIVAEQLALAIRNARLFAESREAIERLESAYGERIDALWGESMQRSYLYDGFNVRPTDDVVPGDNFEVEPSGESEVGRLNVPIVLRGEMIGTIVLERDGEGIPWTETERALAETIGVQAGLSLENARLLQESQKRAHRERVLGTVAGRMRETLDMDLILQTALREIGANLGISNIEIRMQGEDSVA